MDPIALACSIMTAKSEQTLNNLEDFENTWNC